jgi:hypothetical protein
LGSQARTGMLALMYAWTIELNLTN